MIDDEKDDFDQGAFDFSRPLAIPIRTGGDGETIQERFLLFHEANPHVYEALRYLALELVIKKSRTHYSINGLFEVLRWHHHMATADLNSDYKLNNDYRSRYARMLMEKVPRLVEFFELRALHTP
jgi:hypothetical protein